MSFVPRRRFLQHSALALLASHASVRLLHGADADITAGTKFGKVRGRDVGGTKTFKGIPYGADTGGGNRFMPPQDPKPWNGVRDALAYGHSAPQVSGRVPDLALAPRALPVQGEDCLVLNVWTPSTTDRRLRPVLFWCHGGGFFGGSGSSPDTDGSNLSRRGDVVVVAVHHRLNALGFADLTEFGGGDFEASGNVGMLDIVHALRWVKGNIAEFGGDPGNVTVFGQSGGGSKVGVLLTMPLAKGLFHRAVMQSSGAVLRVVDRARATRNAEQLLAKLNLRTTEVRKAQTLPFEQIVAAYAAVLKESPVADDSREGFAPVMDGKILPQHPFDPTASPVMAEVPVLLGSTRTEVTVFSLPAPADFTLDDAGMRSRVAGLVGTHLDTVLDVYRRANPAATPSDLYFLIASDCRFTVPALTIAERRAALARAPVYAYYFTWQTPIEQGRLQSPHSIDVPFVFDNVQITSRLTGGGSAAMALADRVSDAWIAFARSGNPNTDALPTWPAYDAKTRSTMVLDDTSRAERDPIGAQRAAIQRALRLG